MTTSIPRRTILIAALATACSVRHAPAAWVVTTTDESREAFVEKLREFAETEGYDFNDEVAVSDSAEVTLQGNRESQRGGVGQVRIISLQNGRSIILAMSTEPNRFDVSVTGTPEALASRLEQTVLSSSGVHVERFPVREQSR